MVHSGGFFIAERQSTRNVALDAALVPLEALLTWVSGFFASGLLYYSDGLLLDSSVSSIGWARAVAIGIGTALSPAGWCTTCSGLRHCVARRWLPGTTFLFPRRGAHLCTHAILLSGRAAYIHIGALFGTIMSAQRLGKILPASRNMLKRPQARARQPDMTWVLAPKLANRPQTYMTIPGNLHHGQQPLPRHLRQQLHTG